MNSPHRELVQKSRGTVVASKFYVVWNGRQTGIFTDWPTCERQVKGFERARFKGFSTLAEAEAAFGLRPSDSPKAKMVPSVAKAPPLSEQDIAEIEVDVKIFSDGACLPNPGESGSGLAIYKGNSLKELWYGLYNPTGTNNTAELHGLYHALLTAKEEQDKGSSVVIFSDSEYAINCVTKWASSWKKQGWKDGGKDRPNAGIIQLAHEVYEEFRGAVKILHVRGHAGIEGNELADRMSILAIEHEEEGLSRYTESLDIKEILSLTPG